MSQLGRYYGCRDMRLVNSFNNEIMNDVIQAYIIIFVISPTSTITNQYGESDPNSGGKIYYPGVAMSSLIVHPDSTTEHEGYGPDKKRQGFQFRLNEVMCKKANVYPQTGDIVFWDYAYFEIDNAVQDQFLGGQDNKSFSILCDAHKTKQSKLNIVPRVQA